MIEEVRARLRPRIAVIAAVLALAGTVLTVQGARRQAAADTAAIARARATGFPASAGTLPGPGPDGGIPAPTSPGLPAPAATGSGPAGDRAATHGPGATGDPGTLSDPQATSDPEATGDPEATNDLGIARDPAAGGEPTAGGEPGADSGFGAATGAPGWTALPPSPPVTLDVPSIGVHSPLIHLGLNPDGTVEVPPLTGTAPAGWYRHSVTPGETGPAVLLGHVDSAETGRGVFHHLAGLARGAEIRVTRRDGTVAVFTVTAVRRYPKADFPTARVYGPTGAPALRLVTCGGGYDPATRTYVDNVVVYATASPGPGARSPDGPSPDVRPPH